METLVIWDMEALRTVEVVMEEAQVTGLSTMEIPVTVAADMETVATETEVLEVGCTLLEMAGTFLGPLSPIHWIMIMMEYLTTCKTPR